MLKIFVKIGLLAVLFSSVNPVNAQTDECTRILFVLDASQSMLGKWESGSKIDVARKLLVRMVDSLAVKSNVQMALRVYGHQSPVPPQDCNDTKLEVPFYKNNAKKIKLILSDLKPRGTTPIAYSLAEAANDFPDTECRNVIILITDGVEACEGDPCAVSRDLQKKGIILKPFVVGIGLDPDFKDTFNCVGRYYDASNEDRFEDVMGVVITQALNNTTAQVNLIDAFGNPTETNVGLTFYDLHSKNPKYHYYHTINLKGVPDTLVLDPLADYKMVVHTLPPVVLDSISISPGVHNMIGVDAPRGTLLMKKARGSQFRNLQYLVLDSKGRIVNVQNIEQPEKYIAGIYNVEVLSMPRLRIDSIHIKQSEVTKIQIPEPGIVNISTYKAGKSAIFSRNNNTYEFVTNLPNGETYHALVLLPGKYVATFRPEGAHNVMDVVKKEFEIKSGASVRVTVY
ncbi:MAG: VWA domain-containing protein [Salinivirgaceae bacterium]|jgi:Ca-activated chloride channel family protein|nr:VWA domain-containing protein [Salinivirgaceae bacterium]